MNRNRALASQPHRAGAVNPATANCLMWISPEKLAERHEVHLAAGRKLVEEVPCICGNHNRRVYL